MSEYIVEFGYEPSDGGGVIRERIVRCRDCKHYDEVGMTI